MKNLLKIIPIILISLTTLQSCNDDTDNELPYEPEVPTTNTIVDVALGAENLTTLVAALQKADLVTTLASQGPFTVLAPSNDAFNTFLSDNGFSSLEDVPVDVLTNILLNHVIGGRLASTDLTTGYA